MLDLLSTSPPEGLSTASPEGAWPPTGDGCACLPAVAQGDAFARRRPRGQGSPAGRGVHRRDRAILARIQMALLRGGAQAAGRSRCVPRSRSDHLDEMVERRREPEMTTSGIDADFVVPAPQVLNERMTSNDHGRGAVDLQSAHRPQSPLESVVVALDPVVRVLRGVVERGR